MCMILQRELLVQIIVDSSRRFLMIYFYYWYTVVLGSRWQGGSTLTSDASRPGSTPDAEL